MKKVMLLMGFMAFVFISHATDWRINSEKNKTELKAPEKKINAGVLSNAINQFDCTVTQRGSVTVYFVSYEISCTTTASTCKAASTEAISCVKEGIARIREIMQ